MENASEQDKRRWRLLLALPSPQAHRACEESGVSRRPTLATATVVQDYVPVVRERLPRGWAEYVASERLLAAAEVQYKVQVSVWESRRATRRRAQASRRLSSATRRRALWQERGWVKYVQSKRCERRSRLLALPSPPARRARVESGVSGGPPLAVATVQDYVQVTFRGRTLAAVTMQPNVLVSVWDSRRATWR